MTAHEALATRLEQADPDTADLRALRDEVLLALRWTDDATPPAVGHWKSPAGQYLSVRDGDLPSPAESVDDGLALAGDDWNKILGEAMVELSIAGEDGFTLARLPLFISAALVRAAGAQKEEGK